LAVVLRQIEKNDFLYLNVTGELKEIPMTGILKSIHFDKSYTGNFTIALYEPEFIEVKSVSFFIFQFDFSAGQGAKEETGRLLL